ncbi:Aspercryptin biosynthesis cluster-specific transcription regulator atnN [Paramyrothecium foliicola]|nr:Aspercryptin biosynthesis cluster-specific transcription regulator atnN [Paramyrothecium foliicola]
MDCPTSNLGKTHVTNDQGPAVLYSDFDYGLFLEGDFNIEEPDFGIGLATTSRLGDITCNDMMSSMSKYSVDLVQEPPPLDAIDPSGTLSTRQQPDDVDSIKESSEPSSIPGLVHGFERPKKPPLVPRVPKRSRNGCLTCKKRRVKCDERTPECARQMTLERCDQILANIALHRRALLQNRSKLYPF